MSDVAWISNPQVLLLSTWLCSQCCNGQWVQRHSHVGVSISQNHCFMLVVVEGQTFGSDSEHAPLNGSPSILLSWLCLCTCAESPITSLINAALAAQVPALCLQQGQLCNNPMKSAMRLRQTNCKMLSSTCTTAQVYPFSQTMPCFVTLCPGVACVL